MNQSMSIILFFATILNILTTNAQSNSCCTGDICNESGMNNGGLWSCCPLTGNMNIGAECSCDVPQGCNGQICFSSSNPQIVYNEQCPEGYYMTVTSAIINVQYGDMTGKIVTDGVDERTISLSVGEFDYSTVIQNTIFIYSKWISFQAICDNLVYDCDGCWTKFMTRCDPMPWITDDWKMCDPNTCTKLRDVRCMTDADGDCLLSTRPADEQYCCYLDSNDECVIEDGVPAISCNSEPEPIDTYSETEFTDVIDYNGPVSSPGTRAYPLSVTWLIDFIQSMI